MPDNFKTMIVVNPKAGNGRAGKSWPQVEAVIRKHLPEFDHKFTAGPLDAIRITASALRDGYEMIVCIGGDGTINETVNGFFENGAPIRKDAVLGILSMGTGCDFIKAAGIPKDFESAAALLTGRHAVPCDIGHMTYEGHDGKPAEKYFDNITDFGMGGDVVYRVNNSTKIFRGFMSFLIGMLRSQLHYRNKTVALEIDGKPFGERKIKNVIVANGQYFAGGMRIAKKARLDDGLFDVIIMGDMSSWESTVNIKKLYSGDIIDGDTPKIEYLRATSVKASSSEIVMIDMDGEQPGRLPVEITMMPAALRLKTLPASTA